MRKPIRIGPSAGFTLIELLIGMAIVSILAAIAVPQLLAAQLRSRYVRAACDSKTAVIQGIVYANEQGANPGTMQTLRERGYVNIGDTDPWGRLWVYSPAFADTGSPAPQGEMGVCSTGPRQTGVCSFPLLGPVVPQRDGSVGYSSLYGSWQGTTTESGAATRPAAGAGEDTGAGHDPASRGHRGGSNGRGQSGTHGQVG